MRCTTRWQLPVFVLIFGLLHFPPPPPLPSPSPSPGVKGGPWHHRYTQLYTNSFGSVVLEVNESSQNLTTTCGTRNQGFFSGKLNTFHTCWFYIKKKAFTSLKKTSFKITNVKRNVLANPSPTYLGRRRKNLISGSLEFLLGAGLVRCRFVRASKLSVVACQPASPHPLHLEGIIQRLGRTIQLIAGFEVAKSSQSETD